MMHANHATEFLRTASKQDVQAVAEKHADMVRKSAGRERHNIGILVAAGAIAATAYVSYIEFFFRTAH